MNQLQEGDNVLSHVLHNVISVSAIPILLIVGFWFLFDKSAVTEPSVEYGDKNFRFLPRFLSGIYYAFAPKEIIHHAYDKVYRFYKMSLTARKANVRNKFKDRAFKLIRGDVSIMFLPPSSVSELSSLPPETASNIGALGFDLVGLFSALGVPSSARLHYHVVQQNLIPSLAEMSKDLENEIRVAAEEYLPQDDSWAQINPYDILLKMTARASTIMLVGKPWCSNEAWIKLCCSFIEMVIASSVAMRRFPRWTYPFVQHVLTPCRILTKNVKEAHDMLGPVFSQKLKAQDDGLKWYDGDKPSNVMDWLCDLAKGEERDSYRLVQYVCILILASVHTTSFSAINVLYDIMEHPEYKDILREEIKEVSKDGWGSKSYLRLQKMDSVFRESQRFSPPSIIGLRRLMKRDVVLTNGVVLPEGAYVCVGTWSIQQNATVGDAQQFNGLRNFEARQNKLDSPRGLFTAPDESSLAWGLGKTACPGRWFASLALRIMFSRLLADYDVEFLPDFPDRPKNKMAQEFIVPEDVGVKILARKRESAAGSAAVH